MMYKKRFLLYPKYRNRQFQQRDEDNVTLALFVYADGRPMLYPFT